MWHSSLNHMACFIYNCITDKSSEYTGCTFWNSLLVSDPMWQIHNYRNQQVSIPCEIWYTDNKLIDKYIETLVSKLAIWITYFVTFSRFSYTPTHPDFSVILHRFLFDLCIHKMSEKITNLSVYKHILKLLGVMHTSSLYFIPSCCYANLFNWYITWIQLHRIHVAEIQVFN